MKKNYFRRLLLVLVLFMIGRTAFSQINITPAVSPFIYQQNFNSYTGTSATSGVPAGWTASNSKDSYKGTGNGSSNSGGAWSYGTGSDWSLGGLNSGNGGITTYSVTFKNTTGTLVTGLKISYDLEGWRNGGGNTEGMAVTTTGLPTSVAASLSNAYPTAGTTPKLITKSVNLTNLTIANNATFTITWKNIDAAGSDNGVSVDNFKLEAAFTLATPTITPSVTSLTDFGNVLVSDHSSAASFTFDGTDLGTNDVSILAPAEFEISTDNINWYSGTDISPSAGSINDSQIWVRLSPTTVGPKAGTIVLSSTGATDKTISASGTGINGIIANPSTLNLSYTHGQGPSSGFQLTNLKTVGLAPTTGDLTFAPALGAASNYEVSSDNIQWGNSALYPYTTANNTITNPALYVRLKAGLAEGTVASEVLNITGGSLTTSITASGIITPSSLATPIATAATLPTISSFTANWDAVNGATEYLLEVSTSETFVPLLASYENLSVTGTTKIVEGLTSSTIYYYRVRAKANAIVSLYSNTIEAKTSCAPVAVPTAAAQEFCGTATVANLVVTMLTDATAKWYDTVIATTPLTTTEVLTTKSYYVSQTTLSGCESPRIEVAVVIKPIPATLVATAQTFCDAATIANLVPAQEIVQPTIITETFEDPAYATRLGFSGNYPLSTGDWTAKNVTRISNGTSNPYKRLSFSNSSGVAKQSYMISPMINGVKSLTIEAASTINADKLEVTKIVNGVETFLQTLNVNVNGTLVMTTFTVQVNDPSDLQIKIEGKPSTGVNYSVAIGTMVITSYESITPLIKWYDVATNGTALSTTTSLQTGNYFVAQTVNGCESARTEVAVTVTPKVVPDFTALTICKGSEAPALALTSPNGVEGTWSPSVVNTTTTADYVFTPNTGICAVGQTITVTVTEKTIPAFDAIAPVCFDSTLPALPLTSNNNITGIWSPALNNQATTEYTFTPDAGQCATTQTLTIEVTPKTVPSFDAVLPICFDGTLPALPLTSNNNITGTWSPALNNQATTEYTFTPDAGQCATTQTLTVEVTPKTVPSFDAVLPVCFDSTLPALPLTSNNNITGTWSPALNNQATTEYTFTPDAGQCATTQTLTIEVTPKTVPNFASIADLCTGSQAPVLEITSPNGITGTWSPSVIDNTIGGNYVFTPNTNQCATSQTLSVTIKNVTNAPTGTELQDFNTGDTLSDFVVIGEEIKWYDAPTAGNELSSSELIVTGTIYYASQTPAESCGESPERLKIIAGVDLATPSFDTNDFKYYPNPVNDVLTIAYPGNIDSVEVFNLLGQKLMNKTVNATVCKLDVSNLASGTYLINTISGQNSKTFKVIKK